MNMNVMNTYLINNSINFDIKNYIKYAQTQIKIDLDNNFLNFYLNDIINNKEMIINFKQLYDYNICKCKKSKKIKEYLNQYNLKENIDYKIESIIESNKQDDCFIKTEFLLTSKACKTCILKSKNNIFSEMLLFLDDCYINYKDYKIQVHENKIQVHENKISENKISENKLDIHKDTIIKSKGKKQVLKNEDIAIWKIKNKKILEQIYKYDKVKNNINKFKLSKTFINKYKNKVPPFGFNGLGELVYMRTYSRIKSDNSKEKWFETIERVVNGTYNIQKDWLLNQTLGWDPISKQKEAQEMYDIIFNMKFLPPGRGLWSHGTAITEERKLFAALNNCAFVSTEDIDELSDPSEPFCFLMDASMLGVGVGFDTKGANKIFIKKPEVNIDNKEFLIPDSREGWVESLKKLINAYLLNSYLPIFNYSIIRKEGEPIKGFGGISSGHECLKKLHNSIIEILNKNINSPITSRIITDIMNLIGKCVISGNVRRSAEIAFGEYDDDEFINLKNYEKNPERQEFGWASNNSIYAKLGMDYNNISERIKVNGEPGLLWLENMQNYGRMNGRIDNSDHRVKGGNPCVSGDTWTLTINGPKQIKNLINKGQQEIIINGKEYKTTYKGFYHTGNKMTYKLKTIEGYELIATDNHKIKTVDNDWVEISNLKKDDKIVLMNHNNILPWKGKNIKDVNIKDLVLDLSNLPDDIEEYSYKFYKEFLDNIFDLYSNKDNNIIIETKLEELENIQLLQRMYNRIGYFSSIFLIDNKYNIAISNEAQYYATILTIEENGFEDVYDCTVPDMSAFDANGIYVHNCLEQSLESYELCCLVEVIINNNKNIEEFLNTLKYAFIYAKIVTLGSTHWEKTNKILKRNRRIGTSITGITQFIGKNGLFELKNWCETGYNYLKQLDKQISEELTIPRSIKITSIKPSGTVSLLAGATPGIHFPESRFYIRRMRLDKNSELVDPLIKAGYKIEKDHYSPDSTLVVEIPVDVGANVRTLDNVTMWEQLALVGFCQRYWACNQISCTITFDKDTEGDQIPYALEYYQFQLKGISFLPKLKSDNTIYPQLPYEKINEEKYNNIKSNIKPLNFNNSINDIEKEKYKQNPDMYCDSTSCKLIE